MPSKYPKQNDDERGDEKMVLRSIYFDLTLWNAAKAKAKRNRVPLAVIIRQLVKAWLNGEIAVKIDGNED